VTRQGQKLRDADVVVCLVADFRRLRLLLRDTYASINEHDATFPREVWKRLQAEMLRRCVWRATMDPARLKAEVDRE
jgi:hypothetical protein